MIDMDLVLKTIPEGYELVNDPEEQKSKGWLAYDLSHEEWFPVYMPSNGNPLPRVPGVYYAKPKTTQQHKTMENEQNSTAQKSTMEVLVGVSQKESIRRGIPAPDSTVKLPLVLGELTEEERVWVGDRFSQGKLHTSGMCSVVLSVPEPTPKGLREAIAAGVAKEKNDKEEREKKAREDLDKWRLAFAEACRMAREDPKAGVKSSSGSWHPSEIYTPHGRVGIHRLPEDLQELIQKRREEYDRKQEEEKQELERKKQADDEATLPFLTVEEKEMADRGVLDFNEARKRLDQELLNQVRVALPGCEVGPGYWNSNESPASLEAFRQMKKAEAAWPGVRCAPVYPDTFQMKRETADGRTLVIWVEVPEPEKEEEGE